MLTFRGARLSNRTLACTILQRGMFAAPTPTGTTRPTCLQHGQHASTQLPPAWYGNENGDDCDVGMYLWSLGLENIDAGLVLIVGMVFWFVMVRHL